MVDQISRALPEMTWLTSLKQEGYEITLEGQCLSLTALSDFVGNLEAAQYFKRPVEIIDSAVVSNTQGRGAGQATELIQFSVKGTFQMAGIEVAPPPAKPARPARGGR
jgi:Tfp pilus assembly protein PilN